MLEHILQKCHTNVKKVQKVILWCLHPCTYLSEEIVYQYWRNRFAILFRKLQRQENQCLEHCSYNTRPQYSQALGQQAHTGHTASESKVVYECIVIERASIRKRAYLEGLDEE